MFDNLVIPQVNISLKHRKQSENAPTMDFHVVAHQCAPHVHEKTLAAIVKQESGYNPFAIGVVGGRLARPPRNKAEAVATAKALLAGGWNFSMGLGQVNKNNLTKYGLTLETVFDPCSNLRASGDILAECFDRAKARVDGNDQAAIRLALSCYYSGNFVTGKKSGYVYSVVANSTLPIEKIRYMDPALAASTSPSVANSGQ